MNLLYIFNAPDNKGINSTIYETERLAGLGVGGWVILRLPTYSVAFTLRVTCTNHQHVRETNRPIVRDRRRFPRPHHP